MGLVDPAGGYTLPVNVDRALTTLADAATVIHELEPDGRLSSRQSLLRGHCVSVQAYPVVGVRWLAVQQVEAPATEAARLRKDHAIRAALRDFYYVSRDRVRPILGVDEGIRTCNNVAMIRLCEGN